MTSKPLEITAGSGQVLGANFDGQGVNFALFSACAERVELCLYDESGENEIARFDLPEYTHEVWHGYIPDLQPGALYGYRVHGPYEPENGHRFNPNKLLLDPYARELAGELQWDESHFAYDLHDDEKDLSFDTRDSAPFTPKCVVIDPNEFDWQDANRPNIPWSKTVIYEAHVKGFSQLNPAVPEEMRGTYDGLSNQASIDYIKSLGVTTVELLPVHGFPDDQHLLDRGLKNFWGYNTLAFFAPATRYFGPRGIQGFRDMVRAFHDAGIEVILDVVYNHTAEGNELGPTLSFKGIDNYSYYRTLPDQHRYYINDTGTGNTVNTSHPRVLQMILDSLRYWAESMHVDGFRFDLGTVLGREPEGFDQRGGFFDAIMQDPVLSKLKLIGEPWDIGPGGYQVGGFPPGWAEWNDKYRDTVREYWKGDMVTNDFAARLLGSGDLYDQRGRRPWASINFLTAHDGFTLNDLVSYNEKHNEANGEDNNDGHNENRSYNYGAEGPTDDEGINAVRERQKRNFLATLLFSHGTPMLLAGDEFGRSQLGNNNGYCQDSEISWLHWENLPPSADALRDFTRHVLALRAKQPLLRRESWRDGMEIKWFNAGGGFQQADQWDDGTTLGVYLGRPDLETEEGIWHDVLMLFNPYEGNVPFRIPQFGEGGWVLELSTSEGVEKGLVITKEKDFELEGRSLALFRRP
ncbi:glycogen operon protein [Candidatus Pantoea symbiotica]|jgi:glycogen operon protein|uniref:Glycogen operon protein n=1 Tax=Candidatus Pantoea symbiotica TaxID=1884370 RepID=A0A1I3ZJG7_9GAMM|nr:MULTISPECIES: glycogen debranching protein GlgX [Pantoea]KAJ9430014.1 glycogen debranching protein GlgX [Pantoea sp. YR343]MRT26953.1 glycogen debranching protein GlgX [Enterobacteriaceae bacterium RIT697]SFK44238.1 glycogen operon protein [Pantoea symbiotica]SFU93340.1 glycogen operon protein [Pantoea sp. YR525]